jgi:hypothetical protein
MSNNPAKKSNPLQAAEREKEGKEKGRGKNIGLPPRPWGWWQSASGGPAGLQSQDTA